MHSESKFITFESSLNKDEIKAIRAWLGVWYESICNYQRMGEVGNTYIDNLRCTVAEIENNFSAALSKAVSCQCTVYRGISDRFLCPNRQKYIRQLLHGSEIFLLDSHASASIFREIGESFTYTAPDDDERTLSVLLEVSSITGKYLKPFQHAARDEGEVVLLRGSKYRRISAERQMDPKDNLEYWIMQVEEII
ncbi:MAG: hypothetical protein AAFY26_00125 [Cyanobacteria bacterium J06638_22]